MQRRRNRKNTPDTRTVLARLLAPSADRFGLNWMVACVFALYGFFVYYLFNVIHDIYLFYAGSFKLPSKSNRISPIACSYAEFEICANLISPCVCIYAVFCRVAPCSPSFIYLTRETVFCVWCEKEHQLLILNLLKDIFIDGCSFKIIINPFSIWWSVECCSLLLPGHVQVV